jgi:hypothetical protein
MQTTIQNPNTGLSIVAASGAPMPQPVKQTVYALTRAQVATLRTLLRARKAFNAAKAEVERLQDALALPRYTGKACTVSLVSGGKVVGELQVSFRRAYPVPATWVNKLVGK